MATPSSAGFGPFLGQKTGIGILGASPHCREDGLGSPNLCQYPVGLLLQLQLGCFGVFFCSYSFKKSGIFLIVSLWIKKPWPEQQQNCRGAEQAVVTQSCAVLKAKQQICSGFVLVKGRESCPCSCRVKAIGTATNKHSLL